jgi:hypothetical protein
MKLLNFLMERWLELFLLLAVLLWAGNAVHGCVMQDLCESSGGIVRDRGKESWRCERGGR